MAWIPRTTAPTSGTSPYDWSSGSIYECTWYAYWRVQEGGSTQDGAYTPPCWFEGSGSSGYGAYTNAKEWLNNYRDPWEVKGTNYTPVPGDIVVFTGRYGHVVVIESANSDGSYVVTDYNLIAGTHTFGRKTDYFYPNTIQGATISTGTCIGCLHYPSSGPTPPEPPDPPPTPTITPSITVSPSSASVTMGDNDDYADVTFNITIDGIPLGESASGGNTYPGLTRVYNSGWSYVSYEGSDGNTYQRAVKTQTLEYEREYSYEYNITKYMYFSKTFSNGSISSTTPISIRVLRKKGEGILFLEWDGATPFIL